MDKYYPDGDKDDINAVFGYAAAETLFQVLSQCGNDLSHENVMRQAASLRNYQSSVALPGITFSCGQTRSCTGRCRGQRCRPAGKVRDVRCGSGGTAGKRYRCDLGIRLADKSTGLMTSDGQQGMGIGSPQVEGQYSALKVFRKHRMDRGFQVAAALSLREKARTVEDFCLHDHGDEDRPPGLGRQSGAKWIGLREKTRSMIQRKYTRMD